MTPPPVCRQCGKKSDNPICMRCERAGNTGRGDGPNAAIPENRRAPDGMVWRCAACGKVSEDLYGMIGSRSRGWDESCMLNAVPVPASPSAEGGGAQ